MNAILHHSTYRLDQRSAEDEWIEPGKTVMIQLNLPVPGRGVDTVPHPAKVLALIDRIAVSVEYMRDGQPVRHVVPRSRISKP